MVVPDVLHVIVSVVHGLAAVEAVVTHVAVAGPMTHRAVTSLLAAVLLLPSLGIREQPVEVHTEELNGVTAGALLGHDCRLQLRGNIRIIGQEGGIVPTEVVGVVHRCALALLTSLGGDQNHTEGGTGTVNR